MGAGSAGLAADGGGAKSALTAHRYLQRLAG